jgi:hypothetical protein
VNICILNLHEYLCPHKLLSIHILILK